MIKNNDEADLAAFEHEKRDLEDLLAGFAISLASVVVAEVYLFDELTLLRKRGLKAVPKKWREAYADCIDAALTFQDRRWATLGSVGRGPIADAFGARSHLITTRLPADVEEAHFSASVPFSGMLVLSATVLPTDEGALLVQRDVDEARLDQFASTRWGQLSSQISERVARRVRELGRFSFFPPKMGLFGPDDGCRPTIPVWRLGRPQDDVVQLLADQDNMDLITVGHVLGVMSNYESFLSKGAALARYEYMTCGRAGHAVLMSSDPATQPHLHRGSATYLQTRLNSTDPLVSGLDSSYLPLILLPGAIGRVGREMATIRAKLETYPTRRLGSLVVPSLQSLVFQSSTNRYRLARLQEAQEGVSFDDYPYDLAMRELNASKSARSPHTLKEWCRREAEAESKQAAIDVELSFNRGQEMLLVSIGRFERTVLLLALVVSIASFVAAVAALLHH